MKLEYLNWLRDTLPVRTIAEEFRDTFGGTTAVSRRGYIVWFPPDGHAPHRRVKPEDAVKALRVQHCADFAAQAYHDLYGHPINEGAQRNGLPEL